MPFCCVGQCSDDQCIELTEREMRVCELVCGSREPVPFSAMKRVTGLHQTVLSRIVRTLQVHRVIEKTDRGYRLAGQ